MDVAFGIITGEGIGRYHNGFTHSLLCAPVFAVGLAIICRLLLADAAGRFCATVTLAYMSHVILDLFTFGDRGVQLFWPITGARFDAPLTLFLGVRHSVGAPVWVHLLTIANDALFALAVWAACAWWRRRSRIAPASRSSVV